MALGRNANSLGQAESLQQAAYHYDFESVFNQSDLESLAGLEMARFGKCVAKNMISNQAVNGSTIAKQPGRS